MSDNVTWHEGKVEAKDRERLLGQRGCVLWMTGLSGSGKSTVAYEVERRLFSMGKLAYVLDGDNLRHGLNSDLGFDPEARTENLRRVAEVANLISQTGTIVMTATISPSAESRECARDIVGEGRFFEVWVATPLEVCEERDPKGLYARARAGEIENFTGISAPYEEPESPELTLHPEEEELSDTAEKVVEFLRGAGVLKGEE